MFFTSELLSRRDSGFGLLWLAATLGARSSFRKLPKRDVLGADIIQLCGLITEPSEPLALRLSSNLMVGVARVYKVKHDIFLGDVNACFVSLKRAVRDLHALSAPSSNLQMGQPVVRPDAVTVQLDPAMSLGLNLDDFLGDWQDILDAQEEDDTDDEYGRPRKKSKSQNKPPPQTEVGRATKHTLDENLEQMMSGSFDVSFLSGTDGEQQHFGMDTGFDFGDSGDFGFDDIGDELAKELGEGWAGLPVQSKHSVGEEQQFPIDRDQADMNVDISQDRDFAFTGPTRHSPGSSVLGKIRTAQQSPTKKRNFDVMAAHTLPHSPSLQPQIMRSPTPPWAMGMEVADPRSLVVDEAREKSVPMGKAQSAPRKSKRIRLQFDRRIELTDEELKAARAQYVEGQECLRREIEERKLEKEGARLISEMLYGVPPILKAPGLVDFWMDNFKVLIGARSGGLDIETTGILPIKRPRPVKSPAQIAEELFETENIYETHDVNVGMINNLEGYEGPREFDTTRQRSSEEPGQARHASIGSVPTGSAFNLGRNLEIGSGSQKSSLFPWDNARLSSSVAAVPFDMGSERFSIGNDDIRLKDASVGRSSGREGSLILSQGNSGPGTFGFSPRTFGKMGPHIDDTFEFDVPGGSAMQGDQPGMESDLVTLERNSFNFLEYVKMQLQTVRRPSEGLSFERIAPRETSTPHVAAAAFYHCLGELMTLCRHYWGEVERPPLVLATKGVMRVNQVG
ncbi:Rec8 like protein-domain-containing protein, partial [Russula earlei]